MWSRQGRSIGPAALIDLSIAIKPIIILLPLALLIRSESRKTGWWAIGWIVGLMALAQAFLAWRARNLRDLSPIPALQTFLERPIQWACHPENYSPYSLVCRASGGQYFSWQRLVTTAGVLLLILMAVDVIRGHPGRSWVIFAFACLLSPMVSPIAWSHYQILLLPMFVLLAAEFALRGASMIQWLSVAAAYLLAELTWRPLGTLVGGRLGRRAGAAVVLAGVLGVAAVGTFELYVELAGPRRGVEWIDPAKIHDAAGAAAYLTAAGVPVEAPVVYVIDDTGPNPLSYVPEMTYMLRSVLPADRLPHTYFYVGDPDNYLAGVPTYRARPGTYNANARRFWPTIQTLLPRRTVLVPDLPGFGRSAPLIGGHSATSLARAALSVAVDAGADHFDLGGLCLGAPVALAVQRARPAAQRHPRLRRAGSCALLHV